MFAANGAVALASLEAYQEEEEEVVALALAVVAVGASFPSVALEALDGVFL